MSASKSKKTLKKTPKNNSKKTATKIVGKKINTPSQTSKKKVSTSTKTKKKITKKTTKPKKDFIIAEGQDRFRVVNGPLLTCIPDLYEAFSNTMLPEQYLYHAMGAQNDFAEWIKRVLNDTVCARKLKGAEDQYEAAAVLKRRFRYYK